MIRSDAVEVFGRGEGIEIRLAWRNPKARKEDVLVIAQPYQLDEIRVFNLSDFCANAGDLKHADQTLKNIVDGLLIIAQYAKHTEYQKAILSC